MSSVTSRMKGVRDIHGDKNDAFASILMTATLYDEIEISRGQVIVRQKSSEASFRSNIGDVSDESYRLD